MSGLREGLRGKGGLTPGERTPRMSKLMPSRDQKKGENYRRRRRIIADMSGLTIMSLALNLSSPTSLSLEELLVSSSRRPDWISGGGSRLGHNAVDRDIQPQVQEFRGRRTFNPH